MNVFCLIRFGEKKYVEKFINEGEMRFSPLTDHQKSNAAERGDNLEGAIGIVNEEFEKIEADHPTLGKHTFYLAPGTLGRIVHYDNRPIGCFSSYALTDNIVGDGDSHFIDNRMREFGDYAAVIPSEHLDEYFARIRRALDTLGYEKLYSYGYVEYRDLTSRGDSGGGLFTKGLNYSHQSEHRILVLLEKNEPLFIRIGSIKDLCICGPSASWLNTEFKAHGR